MSSVPKKVHDPIFEKKGCMLIREKAGGERGVGGWGGGRQDSIF